MKGNFGLVWLAFGLSAMATATFILGCTAILGAPGIGIGAVVTMLLGNPLSGAQAPWQFMVEPWGRIGQYLVPGASNTLLRSLSYFPDAPMAQQWWTLMAWVAAGVAHEIRNPMTALKGFIQLLKGSIQNEDHALYFNVITSELKRIESIITEFLILAKPQAIMYEEKNIKNEKV